MIKPMHFALIFLLDLWLWVKAFVCILRRRHVGLVSVMEAARKGFRPIPIYQCRFCSQFWIREQDARAIGARRPKA